MKRIVLGLIGLTAVTMALGACDGDNDRDVVYETNNMVVQDEECPRADGQPCK